MITPVIKSVMKHNQIANQIILIRMQYIVAPQPISQNCLLLGQLTDQNQYTVFYQLPLKKELADLLQDLSVKSTLKQFLTLVQDITSLTGFGVLPVGFQFNGPIPEYTNNLSIPKKISDIFEVKHLLFANQTFSQTMQFDLKSLKFINCNLLRLPAINLIRVQSYAKVSLKLDSLRNPDDLRQAVQAEFGSAQLACENQQELSIIPAQAKLSSLGLANNCAKLYFLTPNCQSSWEVAEEGFTLNGTFQIFAIVQKEATVQHVKSLLLQDLVQTIQIRAQDYFTQLEGADMSLFPKSYKEYLVKRQLIEFQETEVCLQNYILEHEQFTEVQVGQIIPALVVKAIKVLENHQEQTQGFQRKPSKQQVIAEESSVIFREVRQPQEPQNQEQKLQQQQQQPPQQQQQQWQQLDLKPQELSFIERFGIFILGGVLFFSYLYFK